MSDAKSAEKVSRGEMIALLRSVADAMERGEPCAVRIGEQSINVPGNAEVEVEYEREGDEEQLEIEMSWSRATCSDGTRNLRAKAGIGLALAAGAVAGGAALLQYLEHQRKPHTSEDEPDPLLQPDPTE